MPTIALVGLSQSGKSLMYFQMKEGKYVDTISSMKENEGDFPLALESNQKRRHKYVFTVIDFPGADRLRGRLWEHQEFNLIDCIVFVIDASTIRTKAHDIALFLMDILLKPELANRNVPVVLAFNKLDLAFGRDFSGKGAKAVEETEEKEKEEAKPAERTIIPLELTDIEEKRMKDFVSIIEKEMHDIRRARADTLSTISDQFEIRPATTNKKSQSFFSRIFKRRQRRHVTSSTTAVDLELLGDMNSPFSFEELDGRVRYAGCVALNGCFNKFYDALYESLS